MGTLVLSVAPDRGAGARALVVDELVIAGWTGRDAAGVEAHIRELEALGVARPTRTPIFYRVAAGLLTQADTIQVVGADATGEAEAVVVSSGGRLWVGVGSDHTDRRLEALGVAKSKQVCAKPLGTSFWAFDEVVDHWDRLRLRSYLVGAGQRELYQDGELGRNRTASDLIERYAGTATLPEGTAMFCGTLPVHGTLRSAEGFELELLDPVLGRSIHHAYRTTVLQVVH